MTSKKQHVGQYAVKTGEDTRERQRVPDRAAWVFVSATELREILLKLLKTSTRCRKALLNAVMVTHVALVILLEPQAHWCIFVALRVPRERLIN